MPGIPLKSFSYSDTRHGLTSAAFVLQIGPPLHEVTKWINARHRRRDLLIFTALFNGRVFEGPHECMITAVRRYGLEFELAKFSVKAKPK